MIRLDAQIIRLMIVKARSDVADMIDGCFDSYSLELHGPLRVDAYVRVLERYRDDLTAAGVDVEVVRHGRSATVHYVATRWEPPTPTNTELTGPVKDCPKCGASIETPLFVPSWTGVDPERGPYQRAMIGCTNDVEYELHVLTCQETA